MNADEKILQASLDAMRELTIDQLLEWKDGIEDDVQSAIEATATLIDFVIAEKLSKLHLN